MSKHLTYAVIFACLTPLSFSAQANADTEAGKSRAALCQGCHGVAGASANPQWPNLAGQGRLYLETQLQHFKSGQRDNAVMKQQTAALSDGDINNLAAYFSALPPQRAGDGDAAKADAGKAKTAMCQGCHGEKLAGNGAVPRLAGQHAAYLAKQLLDFKSGARQAGMMNAIAKGFSEEDIRAVAAYLANLPQ